MAKYQRKNPEDVPELDDLRGQIDQIDDQIFDFLFKRFKITELVGHRKAIDGIDPVDRDRENAQFERISQLASEKGIPL